jgi:hypothetical protein
LPELAKSAGRAVRQLQDLQHGVRRHIDDAISSADSKS